MPDLDRIHLTGRVIFTAGLMQIDLWDSGESAVLHYEDRKETLDPDDTEELRAWAMTNKRIQDAELDLILEDLRLKPKAPRRVLRGDAAKVKK